MLKNCDSSDSHHEAGAATMKRQTKAKQNVVEAVNQCINPFTYHDTDMINIMSGEIGSTEVLQAADLGMAAVRIKVQ